MSIISRATLRITKNIAKDSVFYGDLTHINTIIDENVMDKFEANCPNTGISVEFDYRYKGLERYPNKYEIIANKYAFSYFHNGIYRVLMHDGDYMFELSVTTNKDNDIDLDNGVFVCIYNIDSHGEYKLIDKIKIEGAKLI